MKLLYTSDLHGSKSHYQQVLDALREESADVLILGGDMLPDGDRGIPYYRVVRYTQEDFKTFLQDVREINPDIRILTVFGNHDWIFSTLLLYYSSKLCDIKRTGNTVEHGDTV